MVQAGRITKQRKDPSARRGPGNPLHVHPQKPRSGARPLARSMRSWRRPSRIAGSDRWAALSWPRSRSASKSRRALRAPSPCRTEGGFPAFFLDRGRDQSHPLAASSSGGHRTEWRDRFGLFTSTVKWCEPCSTRARFGATSDRASRGRSLVRGSESQWPSDSAGACTACGTRVSSRWNLRDNPLISKSILSPASDRTRRGRRSIS